MKDYYFILGCKESANADDIKLAYRKLSKKFHPDVNNGDRFFEERFKEIQEAYDTIGNAAKRITYDFKLRNGQTATASNSPNYNNASSRSYSGTWTGASSSKTSSSGNSTYSSMSSSRPKTGKKKAYFSFDIYYEKFKASKKTRRDLLKANTKKLVFFVIIPMALIFTSMNYISVELNKDVSNEQYQDFIKTKWGNSNQNQDNGVTNLKVTDLRMAQNQKHPRF